MKLFLVKTDGGDLIGWGPNDQAYLHKLEAGECIECDTKKARNPKHHAKFFALFDEAFKSQNKYPKPKPLMVALKLEAGWYEEHVKLDGTLVYVPLSISWAQMDQDEFAKFYRDAVIALAKLCPDALGVVAEADEIISREAA